METARLMLRPMDRDDLDAMRRLANEPGVRRYLFDDEPVAIESINEIHRRSVADFAARGFGIWMLREKQQDEIIGFVGLREAEDINGVEILYALSDSKLARGYAIEAAEAVRRYAFERAGLERLVGITDPPNLASWRVLEKLGMREFSPPGASAHLRYGTVTRTEFLASIKASQTRS